MKKIMRVLISPITIVMIALVAGLFIGNIPAHAGSAASSAIMQYEKGMISEVELEQRLKDIGYSSDEIRQVKAIAGVPNYQVDDTEIESIPTSIEENTSLKKTNVDASQADNFMLVMGIASASVVAAIVVAFAKRPL